jgi:large subunit ribosomal protein L4
MTKKLDILDMNGATVGEYTVEDKYIELERGAQAVHDTVIAIQAAERAGTAHTKTRAEVRGGGAKPFRQKGLGRARSGSIRNPIWTGGGTIFGPRTKSYAKKINKKVRKLALKRAFSERLEEGSVILLDNFELKDPKTKTARAVLDSVKADRNVLILVNEYSDNVLKATANITESLLLKAASVNVYQMLRFKQIVITKAGLEYFLNNRVATGGTK